jgi:hypothetical protein
MSVVVVTNVVPNATNVVDLKWYKSNFHILLHQSANALHPLETLCHVPFSLLRFAPLNVSLTKMPSMVPQAFIPLVVFLVELASMASL